VTDEMYFPWLAHWRIVGRPCSQYSGSRTKNRCRRYPSLKRLELMYITRQEWKLFEKDWHQDVDNGKRVRLKTTNVILETETQSKATTEGPFLHIQPNSPKGEAEQRETYHQSWIKSRN